MRELADPELTAFVAALADAPPLTAGADPAKMRAEGAERARTRPKGPELHQVRDLAGPGGLPLRLYRPTGAEPALLVWLHGGGWVIGDLDSHDRVCRRLAERSGLAVLAVDYRKAPEHPWPAAVDDAVAVLEWALDRPSELDGVGERTAVGGDSAGGTTAVLACLRLADAGPDRRPDALVLVYANTELVDEGGSMETEGHGYGLERDDVAWFNARWVPDAALLPDPRVSPLFAPDLSGLPPTASVTCEHDPLRDQGAAFVARLEQAGVPVTHRREPGMVHNFLLWDLQSPACAAAGDRVADDVRQVLGLS